MSGAEKQTDVLEAQLAPARAALAQRQANEHQPELNLSYTTITAPFVGTVGVRTTQIGQFVQPGTQLVAIVPLDAVYITANYMETQLTHVQAGQPVTIAVDTSREWSFTAMSTASHPPAASNSPCCRRTTRRDFHQDRSADTGQDRARSGGSAGRQPASGSVGRADD